MWRDSTLSHISGHGQGVQTLTPPTFSSFSVFSTSMLACVVHYLLSSLLSSPPMTSLAMSIPTSIHLLMPEAALTTCSTAPSFWCLTGPSNATCCIWYSCSCSFPNEFRNVPDTILPDSQCHLELKNSSSLFLVSLREYR